MKKYVDDKFFVKEYGIEKCKQMDVYYEDIEKRKEEGFKKIIENIGDLFHQINKILGIDVSFTYKVHGKRIIFESENFASDFKIINFAWKRMIIKGYGYFFSKTNRSNYYMEETDHSKPCPEIEYVIKLNYECTNNKDESIDIVEIGKVCALEKTGWNWNIKQIDNKIPE